MVDVDVDLRAISESGAEVRVLHVGLSVEVEEEIGLEPMTLGL